MCVFWKDITREAGGQNEAAGMLTSQSAASPAVPKLGFYCHRTHLLSQSIKGWTRSVIEIWIYSSYTALPIGLTFSKNTGTQSSEYPNPSAELPAHGTHHFLVNGRCCDRFARSDEADVQLPSDSPLSIRLKNQLSVLPICLSCSLVQVYDTTKRCFCQ